MSLYSDHSPSRVMVFIDYRNLVAGVSSIPGGMALDLFRMTRILVNGRNLVGAYVFDGVPATTESDDEQTRTVRRLHNIMREEGFRVIARESLVKQGDRIVQKEVDVSLACEMLEHALMDHFDVAVVVSGDRDFIPAMQKVQAAGKRVEVASFQNELNVECRRCSDIYYELDDMPILNMESPVDHEVGELWISLT